MKTKKLFMPLALIFCALLFSIGQAKAQTRPVWVYLETNSSTSTMWYITYHNNDTGLEYNFNTGGSTDASMDVGSVPLGNYTISVTHGGYANVYIDFQYGGNSASGIYEDGPIYLYGNQYTFLTTVDVVAEDTETDIFIANN
ncbi:hypothetical protein ACFGVR_10730 [Mucilaginibacter sp. AW1-3]